MRFTYLDGRCLAKFRWTESGETGHGKETSYPITDMAVDVIQDLPMWCGTRSYLETAEEVTLRALRGNQRRNRIWVGIRRNSG